MVTCILVTCTCTCILVLNCGVVHVCPFFKSTYNYNDIHSNIKGQLVSPKGVWLLVTAFGCGLILLSFIHHHI